MKEMRGFLCAVLLLSFSCRSFLPANLFIEENKPGKKYALFIEAVNPDQVNLDITPGRLYVSRQGTEQIPARLILKVTGFEPGTSVHWLFEHEQGSLKPKKNGSESFFSAYGDFDFDPLRMSSRIDPNGLASVLFTSTTYAGDRFQFGVAVQRKISSSGNEPFKDDLFRRATLKSSPFAVWKRIFLESPKVLAHVQFPLRTWDWVTKNLERMNIEIRGSLDSKQLDPQHTTIAHFFDHPHENLRYGPREDRDFLLALQQINSKFSDQDPKTINIIILGALSRDRDLISSRSERRMRLPQPVDYHYPYEKEDFDLSESYAYGTGYAFAGPCPAVVVFSDYWFVASKILDVPHEKALARVILHELGHHLLMHKTGGKYLDRYGHPQVSITSQHMITTPINQVRPMVSEKMGIMNGTQFIRLTGVGKADISSEERNAERRLIKYPVWNKEIELLIRRDFIPQK